MSPPTHYFFFVNEQQEVIYESDQLFHRSWYGSTILDVKQHVPEAIWKRFAREQQYYEGLFVSPRGQFSRLTPEELEEEFRQQFRPFDLEAFKASVAAAHSNADAGHVVSKLLRHFPHYVTYWTRDTEQGPDLLLQIRETLLHHPLMNQVQTVFVVEVPDY